MAKPDRNAPCPCGSGQKYKRCCLAKEDAAALSAADPVVAEMAELTNDVLRFARREHGLQPMDLLSSVHENALDLYSVPAWFELATFHGNGCDPPIASAYLARPLRPLIAQRCRERMSAVPALLEILEVRTGVGLLVFDHLTREEMLIRDASLSHTSQAHMVGFAFVYRQGDDWRVSGAHSLLLAPGAGETAIAAVRKALKLRGKKAMTREQLGAWDAKAIALAAWTAVARVVNERAEPRLHDTDGEPLVLVKERYRVAAGQSASLLGRIVAVEGAEEPERTDEGMVVRIVRRGNTMNPSWDNTLIGRIVVNDDGDGSVQVETNSVARADDLKARFEGACGDFVTHRGRDVQDAWSAAERLRDSGRATPEGRIDPEEEGRIVREFKEKHYSDWADVGVPALDGLTPRAASKGSPAMRRRLEVLLKDMVVSESRMPPTHRFDFTPILVDLGFAAGFGR